ncbi:DCC1-like thiol-disulfide oxidoreductase family protein [Staphylococcus sp. SQ8-PEA]|uniref:DCC1-like thiol-disulfide oxidoreductase family protein n=1 Tax=Staphylococcus marylandisciuri TaxID=2981529 RepID=A0ABT2QRJ6_9STAP|nr:DCC1-like thiol-disulfide oxidoreductase family protein [Staphylococcus marylandisciuri]MCU5746604.1 DCC1-like thiol-disulfide oxidoreductase family protein [Staphylococcus marylandisciuri]
MPIIYYDGTCVYCYNYAIWLIQNGLSHRYEFVQLQSEAGQKLKKDYPEARKYDSVILQTGDRLQYKSDAIASLIGSLPKFKWLAFVLRCIPPVIRDCAYDFFAQNRKIMWKTHWHQPSDYERSFFIDKQEHVD